MRKLEIKQTTLGKDDAAVNPLHETTVFELKPGNEDRSIVITMPDNETALVTLSLKGDNVVYDVEQMASMLVVGSGAVKEKLPPPPATHGATVMHTAPGAHTAEPAHPTSKPMEHKPVENKPTVSPGGATGSDQLPGRNPSATTTSKK